MAVSRPGFDAPSSVIAVDKDGYLTIPYTQWINRANFLLQTVQQSGPTADRPDSNLWIGRFYYDTDLGKPIWVNSVRPTVWHDASGAVV